MNTNPFALELESAGRLDVRRLTVRHRLQRGFEIHVEALSVDRWLDFEAIVGEPASVSLIDPLAGEVRWRGICRHVEQVSVDVATRYAISIVPRWWLATQRKNYRVFQRKSELDIAIQLLNEWGIEPVLRCDQRACPVREYRVQYGESDFDFVSRLLEEAGLSWFVALPDTIVISEAPESAGSKVALSFVGRLDGRAGRLYATAVRRVRELRPGQLTLRDHDFRLAADCPLAATVTGGSELEAQLEQYDYASGAFAIDSGASSSATADDKGAFRSNPGHGARLASARLRSLRNGAQTVALLTNAHQLAPGDVVQIDDHPVLDNRRLLVTESSFAGTHDGDWETRCTVVDAAEPFRPPRVTHKPRTMGVEGATVVGRPGEEIHTDEFGRVRVQFHWDREGAMDDNSSPWIHVCQSWAGAGFGAMTPPRVGQEVLIDFLGGDPDQPVVVGRLFNATQQVPFTLPDDKSKSGFRSSSTPGGGGYNELVFEDNKGRELVSLRAERDMRTLVRNDEGITVERDRRKVVRRNESTRIGGSRTERVVGDEEIVVQSERRKTVRESERVAIGGDRTEAVAGDEQTRIGNDRALEIRANSDMMVGADALAMIQNNSSEVVGGARSRSVGLGENVEIGRNRSQSVGASDSLEVAGSRQIRVGAGQSVSVADDAAWNVGGSSNESVAKTKVVTVGTAYQLSVGAAMNTTVAGISAEQVGGFKMVRVGQKLEISCGKSKITMSSDGTIAIEGTELVLKADGGNVTVTGEVIDLN